jgi:hypothetical protein
MLKIISDKTTWWAPTPNSVIDARDISEIKVERLSSRDVSDWTSAPTPDKAIRYYCTVTLPDRERVFKYNSIDEMNLALNVLGLHWDGTLVITETKEPTSDLT